MFKLQSGFFKQTLLGGLVIVLPLAILVMGLRWLFQLITDVIQPFTAVVVNKWGFHELVGDAIVIVAMVFICFVLGYLVSTSGGAWFHKKFDDKLSKLAPGYRLITDIVGQFFGDASQSPFANGEVALVQLFGADNPTLVTAIVTSKHADGRFSVFMPTGPNPTSGNIYHVQDWQVSLCPEVKIEDAMRTIIACGAGTGELFSHG
jgi:uncharacterized membrane protein